MTFIAGSNNTCKCCAFSPSDGLNVAAHGTQNDILKQSPRSMNYSVLHVSSVYHVPIYQIKLCVLRWWLSNCFFQYFTISLRHDLLSTIICSHLQNSPTFNLKQLSLKHKHRHRLLVTVLTCLLLFQMQYAHAFPDIQPLTPRIIPFV